MAKDIVFNGINCATGDYLLRLSPDSVVQLALGEAIDPAEAARLRRRQEDAVPAFDAIPDVDTSDLAQAGWGIVFPAKGERDIEDALSPLIEHRKKQASAIKPHRFRVFRDADGYRSGERAAEFVERHGGAFGPVDPDVLPFYLLLVGDPEQIPFSVQYQLDIQFAVGRIWFPTVDAYEQYAQKVVAAETGEPRPRTATFLGVKNPDDPATELSAKSLITPLAKKLEETRKDWAPGITAVTGSKATKARFAQVLGGEETPTLVFTASHGMGFPKDHPLQVSDQGGLLCQDWPGPRDWNEAIPKEFYFAADDVADDANLDGTITFHFACYGAGTPALNDFSHLKLNDPLELASHPFVAALPVQLLQRGALAVVGHVERAWGYSFVWGGNPQLATFVSTIQSLMDGVPLGAAFDYFNMRYAELSTVWADEVKEVQEYNARADPSRMGRIWTASNDARSFVVIGDPAVRLTT